MKWRIMEANILEALALFQYLTSAQLIRLFPHVSLSTINRYLCDLKRATKPTTRALQFGFAPSKWPLAPVYCLTQQGRNWLMQNRWYTSEEIKMPKSRSCFFTTDYFHRIETINFKISFIRWIKRKHLSLKFFHCYFERQGSNNTHNRVLSQSKAAIKSEDVQIIPDALICYQTPHSTELILFEQHMGSDSKRAIKQILWHCYFLSKGIVSKQYWVSKNATVIYVFELESCRKQVVERLKRISSFSEFWPCFRFTLQGSKFDWV